MTTWPDVVNNLLNSIFWFSVVVVVGIGIDRPLNKLLFLQIISKLTSSKNESRPRRKEKTAQGKKQA